MLGRIEYVLFLSELGFKILLFERSTCEAGEVWQ